MVEVFRDAGPAKGLSDLSREAQLVVVGSHGRGRLADSVLGSVSQNLIHHADCPVLVVRATDAVPSGSRRVCCLDARQEPRSRPLVGS